MTLVSYSDLRASAEAVWRGIVLPRRTLIKVGVGTCSRVVGAEQTLEAVRSEVDARGLDADVMLTGCLGLCYAEPLVEVARPDCPSFLYQQVTSDKVSSLLEA